MTPPSRLQQLKSTPSCLLSSGIMCSNALCVVNSVSSCVSCLATCTLGATVCSSFLTPASSTGSSWSSGSPPVVFVNYRYQVSKTNRLVFYKCHFLPSSIMSGFQALIVSRGKFKNKKIPIFSRKHLLHKL